jgi:hypothetical protein
MQAYWLCVRDNDDIPAVILVVHRSVVWKKARYLISSLDDV